MRPFFLSYLISIINDFYRKRHNEVNNDPIKDKKMSSIKGIICPKCQSLNRSSIEQLKTTKNAPTCGKCGTILSDYKVPLSINENQFEKLMKHSNLPIVVDIYADWCGPCKMYAPIFAEVAIKNWDKFNFIKLDSEKNLFFSSKYQIRGIPTTLIFKNGQLIKNQSGLMNADQLQSWVNNI